MFSAILRKTYSSFPPKSLERFAVKCFSGVWSSAATLCVEIKQCFDFFKYIFCLFICLCKLLRNISWRSKLAAIAMLLLEGLWIICQNKLFFIFFCGSNPSASDCWEKLNQSQEMPCITSLEVDFTACLRFFPRLVKQSKEGGRRWKKFPFCDCLKIVSKHSFILSFFVPRSFIANNIIYDETLLYFIRTQIDNTKFPLLQIFLRFHVSNGFCFVFVAFFWRHTWNETRSEYFCNMISTKFPIFSAEFQK